MIPEHDFTGLKCPLPVLKAKRELKNLKKGDQVKKGQLIGKTGGIKGGKYAGNSQGPHLHYEVSRGGRKLDPASVHTGLA